VIIGIVDPSDIQLQNGSFQKGFESWQYDTDASLSYSAVNFSALSALGSCVSPVCSVSSGSNADGLGSVTLSGSSKLVGIFQDTTENALSAVRSRKGLMTAYIDSTELDLCELRVYQDFVPSTSYTHNEQTSGKTFFAHTFETGASTKNLSFEVVNPIGATSTISSVVVYTRPEITTAALTMCAGFWFLFFALCSYTQFGKRPQSRGDPNAELSVWQFVKQVNLNLWDSIKFSAKSLKIATFFIGYSVYQSGTNSIVALAGTYLSGQLQLSGAMTGIVLMYTQIAGIPGAFIFFAIGNKIGLHLSLTIAYAMWLAGTIMAFLMWTDQTTPMANIWIVMTVFGIGGGGTLALARSTFAGLIPQGREAEFMGLYNFASKVIAWSGTLLFTAVNESTKSFPKAFVSLSVFFALAIVFQFIAFLAPVPAFLKSVERISLNDLDTDKPGSPSIGVRDSDRLAKNELGK
jgi:hypothetical protein